MNGDIYKSLCAIFNFNKDTKNVSFGVNPLLNRLDKKDLYKTFLFEFCFLLKNGSVEFNKLDDIWFFKIFNVEEKEIALEIIKVLIDKIYEKNISNEIYLTAVIKLINLNNHEKYKLFRNIQSIYSYYNNNPEYIIYALICTLGFNNEFIKTTILKKDLIDIMDYFLKKINKENKIDYSNINEEFLFDLNKLLYYLNFNKKDSQKNKNFYEFYQYLYNEDKVKEKPKFLEGINPINYFAELKEILIEHEHEYEKNRFDNSEDNINKTEEILKIKYNDEINVDGLNKDSIQFSSNVNKNNPNYINIKTSQEDQRLINNSSKDKTNKNHFPNFQDLIRKEITKYFSLYSKYDDLKILCSRIPSIIKDMNFNKAFLKRYYELLFEISENKLLINKFFSPKVLLQIANLVNIKRKLIEVIPFNLMEKYHKYFYFNKDYYPSEINLKELKFFLEKKLKECKSQEKDLIEKDLNRLNNFINAKDTKTSIDCQVYIDDRDKTGKKLRMIIDFLKFCQNYFHPIVHTSKITLDSLFSSNLKFVDYVFSLKDNIKNDNDKDNKNEEDKFETDLKELTIEKDIKLYKEKKNIEIEDALKILCSNQNYNLNEIDIDKLVASKKNHQDKLNFFENKIGSFLRIIPKEGFEDFKLNHEIEMKESDLINKLNDFDVKISKIIEHKKSRDEAEKIIQEIKELIANETKIVKELYSNFEKLTIDKSNELINSKTNRIYLILNFLKNQREKIDNSRKKLYEEYEKDLNILIMEASKYKSYLREYLSNNVNLFDEWVKEASKENKYKEKYLNFNVLYDNFRDLITSVEIVIDYSYDEKFVLWIIKNNFSQYLK